MRLKSFIIASLLLLSTNAAMAMTAAKAIQVKAPVIDATLTQDNNAEVFMQLHNNNSDMYQLVAATSPIANKVQLHITVKRNHQLRMQQVHGISISSKAEQDLKINGLHIMLIGLKHALRQGEAVPITLIYADGSWKTIQATVKA